MLLLSMKKKSVHNVLMLYKNADYFSEIEIQWWGKEEFLLQKVSETFFLVLHRKLLHLHRKLFFS